MRAAGLPAIRPFNHCAACCAGPNDRHAEQIHDPYHNPNITLTITLTQDLMTGMLSKCSEADYEQWGVPENVADPGEAKCILGEWGLLM